MKQDASWCSEVSASLCSLSLSLTLALFHSAHVPLVVSVGVGEPEVSVCLGCLGAVTANPLSSTAAEGTISSRSACDAAHSPFR